MEQAEALNHRKRRQHNQASKFSLRHPATGQRILRACPALAWLALVAPLLR